MAEARGSLPELNRWLAERHMQGYWDREEGAAPDEPRACIWRGTEYFPALHKAAELVPMAMTEMRTIHGLVGGKGRVKTIGLGTQILMPGEKTRAHRNLKSETRFVLEAAPGAAFIVDGETFPVEEGDLAVAPTWCWHIHYNGSNAPMIWLDGLDAGLVSLGTEINERYVEGKYTIEDRPPGYWATLQGSAVPAWIKLDHMPPFHYRWSDSYATLTKLKESEEEGDPYNGIYLQFKNPVDGGSTVPTLSCELQLLRPQERTKAHRHNSSTIYFAFRGEGVTVVDGEPLEWVQGDKFFIPPWAWHRHENRASSDDAILYSVTDWPAMKALGLYREEQEA